MTIAAERAAANPADLPPLAERLTDRLNPILVKEVRQSLRGRYFKVSFWITQALATVVGLGVLLVRFATNDDMAQLVHGPEFFAAIFACLAIATQVLVPFSAFLSMGGEWDENTFDLLVLSNLKPWQIVLGKVQSAAVQALLFYSSFGPFLVFAFLLRGLDLLSIFVALAISFVGSLLLSCLAVAMSSFSQGRFARLLLMVILSIVLVMCTFLTIIWAMQTMVFPGGLHDPRVLQGIGAVLSIATVVAAFFFASACARLAHPEENRSTGLRLMTLCGVAVGLIWVTIISGTKVVDDFVLAGAIAGNAALAVACVFFVTEPERLGRRVAASLPRNTLVRALATPVLPGGARGLLFFLLGSVLISVWALLYSLLVEGRLVYSTGQLNALVALPLYGLIFLGIPSACFSSRLGSAAVRASARVVIVTTFIAAIILPVLVGFLFGMPSWADFAHPLNVFTALDELLSYPHRFREERIPLGDIKLVLVGGTLLCVMLNLKRVTRAARELNAAARNPQADV
jgi:hypothetical protein